MTTSSLCSLSFGPNEQVLSKNISWEGYEYYSTRTIKGSSTLRCEFDGRFRLTLSTKVCDNEQTVSRLVGLKFHIFWFCSLHLQNLWLGGYKDAEGKSVSGFDTLKRYLGPNFELIEDKPIPFFIRETAHKNQWTVAHATIWKRKSS